MCHRTAGILYNLRLGFVNKGKTAPHPGPIFEPIVKNSFSPFYPGAKSDILSNRDAAHRLHCRFCAADL